MLPLAGKPFDATLKDLIEADAASWAALGSSVPPLRVSFEDADVSSVTAAADKVLRVVDATGEWLLDLEPQSGYAGDAPDALHLYSTLLERRHGLRVRSVLLLLRPEANATTATGILERRHPDEGDPYLVFRYRVVRLWQEPVERFLTGGLGTLPLAALTDEARDHLSGVVDRIEDRLEEEASPALAERLRAATFLLLGLRDTRRSRSQTPYGGSNSWKNHRRINSSFGVVASPTLGTRSSIWVPSNSGNRRTPRHNRRSKASSISTVSTHSSSVTNSSRLGPTSSRKHE